ncbi:lamin tail domain-containing protein [Halocatena salina]|uniref:Lamin tail domain-containing protein n=1 Tax=Halocatena salina TaxID=2934340 RepID=A0A8U0A856_9EURY|nr:lamin tail domain-containing protein [Halocatena salina]UPM45315.1 lamin tail domain-containing protein [Halocatena salina]
MAVLSVAIPAGVVGSPSTTSDTLSGTVTEVVDGDTVDIEYANGTTDTVRLLGIDTPEIYGENDPTEFEGVPDTSAGEQCLADAGDAASAYTKDVLQPGEQVTLELDAASDGRGDYGRLLAYIHDDGQNLNYDLIQTGHARVYDSEFSQSDRFYAAESDAQAAERGLWQCRNAGSESSLSITEIHADAAGNDNDNLNDEYVVFENTGTDTLDLSGWSVSDDAGHTYMFPSGASLAAGGTVTLHTGSGSDTASDRYWGSSSAIWNNGGDTVTVTDSAGTVMTSQSY